MADISKIKTPDGVEYNFKDLEARSDIVDLQNAVSGASSQVAFSFAPQQIIGTRYSFVFVDADDADATSY